MCPHRTEPFPIVSTSQLTKYGKTVDDELVSSILGFVEPDGCDDWLNDSPEQIAQEDAEWDAVFARNRDKMREVAAAAIKEYEVGDNAVVYR